MNLNGKKYMIVPGNVTSISDGQTHFITSSRLIMLYGLCPDECLIYHAEKVDTSDPEVRALVWLGPRPFGDYETYLARAQRTHEKQQKEKEQKECQ